MVRLDAPNVATGNYNLWRLMIDKNYQHKGYGRQAVKLALDFIKTYPGGTAKYKGCMTDFVCHTASTTNVINIFKCGALQAPTKWRGVPAAVLKAESLSDR